MKKLRLVLACAGLVLASLWMPSASAVSGLSTCVPNGSLRHLNWDTGSLSRVWLQSCVRNGTAYKANALGVWSLTNRDNSDIDEVDVLTSLLRTNGTKLAGGPCYYYSNWPEQPNDMSCNGDDYTAPSGSNFLCYAHIRVRIYWNNGRDPSTTEFVDSDTQICPSA